MVLLSVIVLDAQPPAESAPTAFGAVSIKPNLSGSGSSHSNTSRGRLTAVNVSAKMYIQWAFGIKDFQIAGGPAWLDTARFDITAVTGTSEDLNDKALQSLLQAMLAERFHLTFHREMKELPIYSLIVAKGGPKLTPHTGEGSGSSTHVSSDSGKATMSVTRASLPRLADILGRQLNRTVVDNTGLPGEYDLKMDWAPNPTAETEGASIFTAVQEQLGLKLESTKGPVEMIVIDTMERPSEN
jgi:uncharacterized protein (TIGR03435 family)